MADVPRHFHFVFGLRPQTEPFHLAHYLCLESCRQLNAPVKMFFHYRHMPYGHWWDKIAPHLTLRPVHESPKGFDSRRYADSPEGRFIQAQQIDYAHEADFIRLEALIDSGGVYADMDTLFVSPYPDELFRHACVLGEEDSIPGKSGISSPSLCNAVIMAQPAAPFLQAWRAGADQAFDGKWSSHSCQLATRLWRAHPGDVHVAPRRCFYEFGASRIGLQSLFTELARKVSGIHSIHLWAHLWWSEHRRDFSSFDSGLLAETYVRYADTTYAHLARRFL